MLVLAGHINFSNSKIREHRPKRHQQELSKVRISHQEVQSTARVTHPELQSKVRVSHPEVHSKAVVSHLEIHSQVMEIRSKTGVSSPKIFEKLLRLERHSNQLEQTGNVLIVKDCPLDCYCELIHSDNQTELVVSNCTYDPISSLPKLFDSHRNITQVYLTNCHLTRLPPEIMKLPLVVVTLDRNEFTELPRELLGFPKLVELYMNYNKLSYLPADVTKWSELTSLQLSYNKLKSLPAEIGNLTQLLILYVANNQLKTVPSEMGRLTTLHGLQLQVNEIMILPNEITKLNQLYDLDLSNNPLGEVPAIPESLVQLRCNKCSIHTLPCKLFTEGNIQILFLRYNYIKTVDCGEMSSNFMTDLDLRYNALQEIPCENQLAFLESIWLSYNNISTLPKTCSLLNGELMREIDSSL